MEHLSDIDIAKILTLAKAFTSERKIASLIKCSKTSVYDTLNTYDFETFQGCNSGREYQCKTTKRKDRYIERCIEIVRVCALTQYYQYYRFADFRAYGSTTSIGSRIGKLCSGRKTTITSRKFCSEIGMGPSLQRLNH